jgi:hypothetical protein
MSPGQISYFKSYIASPNFELVIKISEVAVVMDYSTKQQVRRFFGTSFNNKILKLG